MRALLCASIAALIAGSCGASQSGGSLSYGDRARRDYEEALDDYRDGNCTEAEPAFRKVRRKYSYSRFAALAELRIADCKLKEGEYAEAIQAYRRFVRYRPSHSEVPYARFKIAQCYYEQIPEDWLLAPPSYERDQGPTRDALRELRRFILDYTDDPRRREAETMARACLRLLARHELYAAEFYLDRDHPQAAVARLNTLLHAYRGSGIEPEALLLLGRTYLHLRKRDDAQRTFRELVARFPRSGYATQARAYLGELRGG